MTVTEEVVRRENGTTSTYGIVNKEASVLIIPWENKKTTIVGQYRYPVKQHSWEFVQGHYEHSSIKKAAISELKEESGITAEEIKQIGKFYLAPGHLNQVCYVFLAQGLTQGSQELERSEKGMKVKTITLEKINKMITEGEITDGPTIVGLKIFENYLQEKK